MNNHQSLRKEIVSCEMLPKNQLIRIVKNKQNEVFIDPSQKANGRGVYIKADLNHLEIAKNKNLIAKSLKTKIDPLIYLELENYINENR
ncbi:RNase P modulator RnpM [Mycoplasma putrefaciens]|uniref:YlxR domain-containing protein n=2 Tax=Mycoplasma putrefaciens TaxID=2123 RepID=M9WD62_9MOLU|nr:YlxR family protein [Mycoplasma putrefaciens]AEM68843.1 uncharacterized protein MPUT_0472 [Mycoplasma putrefaciens KS1]AGJ90761.1 Hypothetical protein MPUT9231_3410 [Mycoplasma putrefaciens Mput9231]SYV96162.1 Protein of uncharacterised function (DUF448) [Mycoplasma putrefaciens]